MPGVSVPDSLNSSIATFITGSVCDVLGLMGNSSVFRPRTNFAESEAGVAISEGEKKEE